MRPCADENIDRPIVTWLREQGHDVIEVSRHKPGARDADLITWTREDNRVLLTFDRDMGRIICAQKQSHPGVVYLRMRGTGQELWDTFARIWPRIESAAAHHFVTVRNHQVRRWPIPMNTDS